jgi:hypothetical protein
MFVGMYGHVSNTFMVEDTYYKSALLDVVFSVMFVRMVIM